MLSNNKNKKQITQCEKARAEELQCYIL